MNLPDLLYTAAVLRAREVEIQTGWPATLLVPTKNVTCDLLEAIGLRLNVDEWGVFDVCLDGEFTFAEIVDGWRAEAIAITADIPNVSKFAKQYGISRQTAYRYLAGDLPDVAVFKLIGEPEITYRGLWELTL